jgi:hypothetical protein
VTQRTTLHRRGLVDHVTLFDPNTTQALKGLTGKFVGSGLPQTVAQRDTFHLLDGTINRHATMMAFNDIFWLMCVLVVIGLPLLFWIGRRSRATGVLTPASTPQRA